jgi:type II secretion system protein N
MMARARSRLRAIFRGAGWIFLYLLLTVLFVYVTLPFEKIKSRYLKVAEDRLGADIIGKIEKSWFTGLAIKGLRIIPRTVAKGEKAQELEIEEGSVRLSILPLFLGRVQGTLSAKLAGGGEVSGRLTRKWGGALEAEASITSVDLKALPFLKKVMAGRKIEGVVSGTAILELGKEISASNGKIDLTVRGVKLDSFQIPIAQWGNQPFTIPALQLGDLKADIQVADGAAKINRFNFEGSQDIVAGIEGYALLRSPLAQTDLRAHLRFGFSDAFFQKNPKFTILQGEATMRAAQRPDRSYGFLLEGPIGAPQYIRRTPMPNPPGNLTPPKGAVGPPGAPPAVRPPGAPPQPPLPRRGPGGAPAFDEVKKRLGK